MDGMERFWAILIFPNMSCSIKQKISMCHVYGLPQITTENYWKLVKLQLLSGIVCDACKGETINTCIWINTYI